MQMNYQIKNIKEGIKLHIIKNEKFKTNIIAIFLTVPLDRKNITMNSLVNLILHRGSQNLKTQEEINKKLEELYGATFDYGIEKSGDNHVFKFYIESINDKFLDEKNNVFKSSVQVLSDIIFNPLHEDNKFNEEYFESEKGKLRQIINSKIDNKNNYALYRCIEEMYEKKVYGLYKYGYSKDLEYIQNMDLYERYKQIINESKIDIFVSGDISQKEIEDIESNGNISNLSARKAVYNIENGENDLELIENPKEIVEKMNVAQGKIVIGLNINENNENTSFVALIYNAILGGTANSKLFQNVREKASLAYTASSNYLKPKNNIFIRCGINIENYDKTIKIINEQLEDIKNGKFEDEDIENAKRTIVSTIKGISDEQDTEITFYLGQELSNRKINLKEYESNINRVSKTDVINLANKISINATYFLKGVEENYNNGDIGE